MCRDGRDARRCARRHRRPAAPATPADAAINTGTPRWGSGEASVAGGGGGDKRTRPPSRVASHQEGVPPMPLLPATPAAMDEGAAAAGHGAPAGERGERKQGVKTFPSPPAPLTSPAGSPVLARLPRPVARPRRAKEGVLVVVFVIRIRPRSMQAALPAAARAAG